MLIQIAETAQWWPAVLRCRPIVEPEQAAFWHALQAGGPEWVARLRAAVEVVMDKIAWEAIGKRQPLLQKTLESAQSELLDARAEAEASARLARDMREEFASKLTEIESAGDLRRELLGEFEAAKAAVAGAAQRAEIVQSEILSALAKLEGAGVQAKMVHGEMEVVRLRIEEANEQAKATADGVVAALQSLQQALVAQENRRNLSMPDPTAVLFARLASLRRASTEAMRRLRGHFRRTRSRRQRAQSVGKEN